MATAPDLESEKKTERLGMALTPTELEALKFIRELHGDRYDGDSSVLRDYSLTQAVELHRRAKEKLGA